MKKTFTVLLLILLAIFSFAACNSPVENVSILVIGADGETIAEVEPWNYNTNNVAKILELNNDILEIPQAQFDSGFITTIAGVTAVWGDKGNQWWWRFDVNGIQSDFGIRDTRVKSNAVISFTLVEG